MILISIFFVSFLLVILGIGCSSNSRFRRAILQLPCCPRKQGELLENRLQNLQNKWPPHPVHKCCVFWKYTSESWRKEPFDRPNLLSPYRDGHVSSSASAFTFLPRSRRLVPYLRQIDISCCNGKMLSCPPSYRVSHPIMQRGFSEYF